MRKSTKILSVLAACLFLSSTAALACHSDYFDEIFAKIQKQQLDKAQIAAIWQLKEQFDPQFAKLRAQDHQEGRGCAAHDKHVPTFIASAAGVLSDEQFQAVTGQEKTEVQKLRYEIFTLKQEIAEIKALLAELKK